MNSSGQVTLRKRRNHVLTLMQAQARTNARSASCDYPYLAAFRRNLVSTFVLPTRLASLLTHWFDADHDLGRRIALDNIHGHCCASGIELRDRVAR